MIHQDAEAPHVLSECCRGGDNSWLGFELEFALLGATNDLRWKVPTPLWVGRLTYWHRATNAKKFVPSIIEL